jgi:hypothetical protein
MRRAINSNDSRFQIPGNMRSGQLFSKAGNPNRKLFLVWNQESGIWNQESGINLASGQLFSKAGNPNRKLFLIWNLESGIWNQRHLESI